MFWLMLITGGIGVVLGGYWLYNAKSRGQRIVAAVASVVCLAIVVLAFFTPQGKMYSKQLIASGKSGNWLIVDNSGGATLRHWIIEDGYVGSSDQSDGWKFSDGAKNGPCYVSGDAYVMRINEPLEQFLTHYKQTYNIPEDQDPIHFRFRKE